MCFFLSETGGAEEGNKSKGFASQQGSFLCSAQEAVPGAGVSTWGQRAAPLQPLDEAGVAVAEPPAHPGPRGIEVSLQSTAHFLWVSNQSEKKNSSAITPLKYFSHQGVDFTYTGGILGGPVPARAHGVTPRQQVSPFFCTSGSQRELCKGAVS